MKKWKWHCAAAWNNYANVANFVFNVWEIYADITFEPDRIKPDILNFIYRVQIFIKKKKVFTVDYI